MNADRNSMTAVTPSSSSAKRLLRRVITASIFTEPAESQISLCLRKSAIIGFHIPNVIREAEERKREMKIERRCSVVY
jgi:hypothetical protein